MQPVKAIETNSSISKACFMVVSLTTIRHGGDKNFTRRV
jgi:hypothetical protein